MEQVPHLWRERYPERGIIVTFCKDCLKQYEEEMEKFVSALEAFIDAQGWYLGSVPLALLDAFTIACVTQGAGCREDLN